MAGRGDGTLPLAYPARWAAASAGTHEREAALDGALAPLPRSHVNGGRPGTGTHPPISAKRGARRWVRWHNPAPGWTQMGACHKSCRCATPSRATQVPPPHCAMQAHCPHDTTQIPATPRHIATPPCRLGTPCHHGVQVLPNCNTTLHHGCSCHPTLY